MRQMRLSGFFIAAGLSGLLAASELFADAYPEPAKFLGRSIRTTQLVNVDGKPFTLRPDSGKPIVLIPVFTSCPVTCPTILKEFQVSWAEALPSLATSGAQVAVVSFDPADTRAGFKKLVSRQKLPKDWIYAVPKPGKDFKEFEALLADLDFRYFKLKGQGGGYAHPAGAYIFDGGGKAGRFLAQAEFTKEDIVNAVKGSAVAGSAGGNTSRGPTKRLDNR